MPKISDFSPKIQRQIRERLASSISVAAKQLEPAFLPPERLTLTICGNMVGVGKNNIGITRTGKRYPKACFVRWREAALAQIGTQLPKGFKTITQPVNIRIDYYAGDKRRKDQTAIFDAAFHCLEKAGIVADDALLWVTRSTRSYDKQNPRIIIEFLDALNPV